MRGVLAAVVAAALALAGCGAGGQRPQAVRPARAERPVSGGKRASANRQALADRSPTGTESGPWLLSSDIHFTPFAAASTSLIEALEDAPVSEWAKLLASTASRPSGYGADTNNALLDSTLEQMRRVAPAPAVVMISGDLLAHDFRESYEQLAPHPTQASYEAFVDKTVAFLARQFDDAFPSAQFVLTLGNNDSYCGDYEATPRSPFLKDAAAAWEPLVDRDGRAPDFATSFAQLGSYEASLPLAHLEIVSLDDVFFSSRYENACGSPDERPAAELRAWLRSTIERLPAGQRAWLLTHMPPGIDVHGTIHGAGAPKPILDSEDQAALLAALAGGRVRALIFGHLHMSTYRVAPRTPMLGVPAVSPLFGNNPAFLTATVDEDGTIADYSAYILQLQATSPTWRLEYEFDRTYGLSAFDVRSLRHLQGLLADNGKLRAQYRSYYVSGGQHAFTDAEYPAYACGSIALTAPAFDVCRRPVHRTEGTHRAR